MRFILILTFLILDTWVFGQPYAPVDDNSTVKFKIKNFGSTVDGSFKGLKGTIEFDLANPLNARFDITINSASIDTGIGMRDNHLRKTDYLGVADSPTIRFVSTKVEKSTKPNETRVTGKLTIKKTTREISFPFRYTESNGVLQFLGEFTINRRDYEVGGGSISLADDLTVFLNVKASR